MQTLFVQGCENPTIYSRQPVVGEHPSFML